MVIGLELGLYAGHPGTLKWNAERLAENADRSMHR